MFGYIKPLTPELRIREHECYRAYYCGLCRAMGKCTGQCSRMTLSYDFVFLAAVRCWQERLRSSKKSAALRIRSVGGRRWKPPRSWPIAPMFRLS